MKNRYEIIEEGTLVELEDLYQNVIPVIVSNKAVIIYANGKRREWKILIDYEDLEKVDIAINGRWYVGVCRY
jgi:hypothetical protein